MKTRKYYKFLIIFLLVSNVYLIFHLPFGKRTCHLASKIENGKWKDVNSEHSGVTSREETTRTSNTSRITDVTTTTVNGLQYDFIHEPSNLFNFTSNLTCSNENENISHTDPKWRLVITVKSSASNFDRRTAVRESWAKYRFINGCLLSTIFLLGSTNDKLVQNRIDRESSLFNDVLQFDGPDDYSNMYVKVTTGMKWISNSLSNDVIYASTDDDFIANLPKVVEEFELINNFMGSKNMSKFLQNSPILCVYYKSIDSKPFRDPNTKYYVPKSDFSADVYPPYCGGGFYMMPVAMVRKLYRLSLSTRHIHMDDVWITGILRSKLGEGNENIVEAGKSGIKPEDLWKHLWADYGPKKDIPNLAKSTWRRWDSEVLKLPHCL